jgi:hypothetical protein
MEALRSIPPVTRLWLLAAVSCTSACYFEWASPLDFVCSWKLMLIANTGYKGLFLTWLYLGPPSFSLLLNLYFLCAQGSNYEMSPVVGNGGSAVADFTWQLLLGMVSLLVGTGIIEPLFYLDGSLFLALGLASYLRGLWAFSVPYAPVNYLGQGIEAWKLPAASLGLQVLTNGAEGLQEDIIASLSAYAVLVGLRHRQRQDGRVVDADGGGWPGTDRSWLVRCLAFVAGTPRWWASLLHLLGAAPPPPPRPLPPGPHGAAAGVATPGASLDGFYVGDLVEVAGTSVEELNGEVGVVRAVVPTAGRLQVQLAGHGGRTLALRPMNLRLPGPRPPAPANANAGGGAAQHEHVD